jgi:hypothetical protein
VVSWHPLHRSEVCRRLCVLCITGRDKSRNAASQRAPACSWMKAFQHARCVSIFLVFPVARVWLSRLLGVRQEPVWWGPLNKRP